MSRIRYFIRTGVLRLVVEDTAKERRARHKKKRKITKRTKKRKDKWVEFKKRFAWVDDLLKSGGE